MIFETRCVQHTILPVSLTGGVNGIGTHAACEDPASDFGGCDVGSAEGSGGFVCNGKEIGGGGAAAAGGGRFML